MKLRKVGILSLGLFLILLTTIATLITACSNSSPTSSNTSSTYSIYYSVTGTLQSVNGLTGILISYQIPNGNAINNSYSALPFTSPTYTFSSGELALIDAADLVGCTTTTVNIYKNGALWLTNTSNACGASVNGTL